MAISSNSTITNQNVPNFKIVGLTNGQILVYNSSVNAFINTSTLTGTSIVVGSSNISNGSIQPIHLDIDGTPSVGDVVGIDANGNLTYITLDGSSTASLSGLTDTIFGVLVSNQYLKYNGTAWINSAIDLNDVDDIDISGMVDGEVLVYGGGNWTNRQLDYSEVTNIPAIPINDDFTLVGLSDTNDTALANGFLRWNGAATQINYVSSIDADTDIINLSTVATSGVYADLTGKPNLAIYAESADLATVATTGDYNDLDNLPIIPTLLSSLSDVSALSPSNGQILKYNFGISKWQAVTELNATVLDHLTDVEYTALAANRYLRYDGSNWTDSAVDWTHVSNKPSTFVPSTHTHVAANISDLSSWLSANNNTLTLQGLSDTDNAILANGYLRWDSSGVSVSYETTIPASVITGLETVAISGDYGDLLNAPSLATVATTGDFGDLINVPTIATDLDDLTDVIVSNPLVSQVLRYTGGAWVNTRLGYSDLNGLPTLFDGAYASLSGIPATFTPAVHTHVAADITDLGAWLITQNSSLTLVDLAETANSSVPNGFLRWNGTGTTITYVPITPSDITGLATVGSTGDYNDLINSPSLATVATTGDFGDLINVPTIVADLDDLTDVSVNNPLVSQVLRYTGGTWVNTRLGYSDLNGLPTLFDGAYASLSGIPATFTPAVHTHVAADITDLGAWLITQNSSLSFTDLSDATNASVSNGYLRWNGTGTTIIYEPTISSSFITGLSAVALSNDYDDLTNLPSIPSSINDLSDVVIGAPSLNQYLRYNGTNWINTTISYSHISGTPTNASYTIQGLSNVDSIPVADGFLRWDGTASQVEYVTTIDATSGDITNLATVATTGDYTDLINTPTIPTNNSFTLVGLSDTSDTPIANGFLKWNAGGTSIQYSTTIPYTAITGLATVAITGSYASLSGTPNLGVYALTSSLAPVATAGTYASLTGTPNLAVYALTSSLAPVATAGTYASLTGTPNLAVYALASTLGNVATSDDYNDLINTPTIPVNNSFSFLGLNDTNDIPVNSGYLRWNPAGTSIIYENSISTANISGLSAVATSNDFNSLINKPTNNSYSFVGLNDTDNVIVPNGYLRWNAGGSSISYSTTISAASITGLASVATGGNMNDLADVVITSPSTGQYIRYSATQWINDDLKYADLTGVPSTFTPAAHVHVGADITDLASVATVGTLNSLDDVVAPTPVIGEILTWNGANWVPDASYTNIENLNNTANSPNPNGYLRWNTLGTTVVYEDNISSANITGLSVVATSGELGDLDNVDVSAAADGYVLAYDAGSMKWTAQENSGGGGTFTNIGDLADVNIYAPSSGKVLRYDGSEWKDSFVAYADVTGTPTNSSYTLTGLSDTANVAVSNGYLKWNAGASAVEYVTLTIPDNIEDLGNVDVTGLSNGDVLVYNSVSMNWEAQASIPTDIEDLSNVDIAGLADGYILVYNSTSTNWEAQPQSSFGGSLDDISDVNAPSPTTGNTLLWSGTEWQDGFFDFNLLDNLPSFHAVATSGDFNDLINPPSYAFEDLTNVSLTPLAEKYLRWNAGATDIEYVDIDASELTGLATVATTGDWTDLVIPPTSGDFNLQDLNDVTVAAPLANGFLKWNAGATEVEYTTTLTATAISGVNIEDLDNVDITGLATGDVLVYDGADWVPQSSHKQIWQIKVANYTAVHEDSILANTSGGAFAITLPIAPNANDYVYISDYAGTFSTYKCTVNRNGNKILGATKNIILSRNNMSVKLTYIDSTVGWILTEVSGEEPQWYEVNVNYTAVAGDSLLVNTSGGPLTITMPLSPRVNDKVNILDMNGTFGAGKKCTIARNGTSLENIMGLAEDLEVTTSNTSLELTYIGGTNGWKVTKGAGEIITRANNVLADLDIYVDTTGNDTTGDGSLASPYATLNGALRQLNSAFISNDAFVTINIAAGEYVEDAALSGETTDISHPFGNRIKIIGETNVTSTSITSVNGTPTLTSFSFNVSSGTGFATGDYVVITGTTGTNDHKLIRGVYEATNVTGNVITINPNYQGLVAELTAITLTGGTVTRQETILKYNDLTGIRVRNGSLRLIDKVTIVGDNSTDRHGIVSGHDDDATLSNNSGGSIDVGDDVNIYGFGGGKGIFAAYGGYINADNIVLSRNDIGIECAFNGTIRAEDAQIVNNSNRGVLVQYGGTIHAGGAFVAGCANEALMVKNGGIIYAENADISLKNDLAGLNVMVYATGIGGIFIGSIVSVTYDPTHNTAGNGNAYIGSP